VGGLRFWLGYAWWPALILATLAAFFLAPTLYLMSQSGQPREDMTGEVVRFGTGPGGWSPRTIVVVRLADGRSRDLRATMAQLSHCRPGSRIGLIRQGAMIFVAPRGCRAPR